MNERVRSQATLVPKPSFAPVHSNLLQRKCACGGTPGVDGQCTECRNKRLQAHQFPAPSIVDDVLRSPGQPLDPTTRAVLEPRFGHDFSQVRVYADAEAAESAQAVQADAYTVGNNVVFGPGQYAPQTTSGRQLLAHELSHTLQQGAVSPTIPHRLMVGASSNQFEQEADTASTAVLKGTVETSPRVSAAAPQLQRQHEAVEVEKRQQGNDAEQVKDKDEAAKREDVPWLGQIHNTWSAALRTAPEKDLDDPYKGISADLPRGTYVTVIGRKSGWLHVRLNEQPSVTGYISQELVKYIGPGHHEIEEGEKVYGEVITVAKAFLILKRAETTKAQDPSYSPSEIEANRIDLAIAKLESTDKYTVDPNTYQVSFKQREGQTTTVTSIEDFILFVETVERLHPGATPSEIASEIRQLWFSDVNWELLVASQGITEKTKSGETKFVDIESPPNKIAMMFAMQDLAPKSGGKKISTPMGDVDIGHVMAGIDAALSGAPSQFPKTFLKALGHHSSETELKFKTLMEASGGDVRDFTTWAGDLGQAYAEYLVDRWVKGTMTADLDKFVKEKTSDAQLLGDIHGYIAVNVWQEVPAESSPSGTGRSVSNILRDLYLVSKKASGTEQSYQKYFEGVSGKKSEELRAFVTERTRRFARPWYAKKAFEHKGYWSSEGWGEEAILDNLMKDFDEKHNKNDAEAREENKLDGIVKKFMDMLKRPMP